MNFFNDILLTDGTNRPTLNYFYIIWLLFNYLALWVSHFWPIWLTAEAKFVLILGQKYENSYSLSKMSKKVSNE